MRSGVGWGCVSWLIEFALEEVFIITSSFTVHVSLIYSISVGGQIGKLIPTAINLFGQVAGVVILGKINVFVLLAKIKWKLIWHFKSGMDPHALQF